MLLQGKSLDDDSIEVHMTGTIVVVEDNPLIAQFLSEALTDEGYAVRMFDDGRSALAAIIAQPPDLVLLDLGLPLMSGEEVLIHLRRQLGAELPIIIMTASLQRLALTPEGATAFLAKPFGLHELIACVAQYVRPHECGA
jgi:two-component system KDP operon response regulator KdpE